MQSNGAVDGVAVVGAAARGPRLQSMEVAVDGAVDGADGAVDGVAVERTEPKFR